MSSTFSNSYLQSYWPPAPNNPDMWLDNLELLKAYFNAAQTILDSEGHPVSALDISTGPCLAPLMATMSCISEVRLSDYEASNRDYLVHSDIEYWRRYAEELSWLFPAAQLKPNELISRLDGLRRENEPLDVNLRRDPIFLPEIIAPASVELMSMHFVVDSISKTSEECFLLLARAMTFVRHGGWLLLSALIESRGWPLGESSEPSPNLKEEEFDAFFKDRGDMVSKTRSTHKPKQIYDGRWTVFLVRKDASSDVS